MSGCTRVDRSRGERAAHRARASSSVPLGLPRRAPLLRAREEPRRRWASEDPRSCHIRLRPRLPTSPRADLGAVPRRLACLRGREGRELSSFRLTAVPVFFLARRFVDERSALVAAALSVTIPSLLYAGTLMTEVALYPTFALALLAIAVALERPPPSTQAAALGAIALASVVKVLALTLLVGYLAAIVMFHWLDTRQRAELRARARGYWPTGLVLALGGLLVVGRSLAAGRGDVAARRIRASSSVRQTCRLFRPGCSSMWLRSISPSRSSRSPPRCSWLPMD